ncbi:phosphotransferase [Streptomyces sp. NPDC051173]|uniref:phosphotransferase n=1 Tax=Streptomyces sp. NPDC051173 TaxID=3155164 RepID=UPI00344B83DF
MKIAIVGCGAIASRWIRVLAADTRITITALIDPDTQAAEQLADRHGLVGPHLVHADTARLPELGADAVALLTPPGHHAALAREALMAGLHVLAEKPLALSYADAVALVALAERTDRRLMVMQNRALDPRFLAFRDAVHSSKGPWAVTAETLVALHQPGFRARQPWPVTSDLAVHAFDQIRQLITTAPTGVHCTETPLAALGPHCSLAHCTVTFDDGSVFSYRGGYTTGPALRTPAGGRWTATGADGATWWDGEHRLATAPLTTPAAAPAVRELGATPPGYQVVIAKMIDALHGQAHPDVDAARNLGSIALLDAALASAASSHHGARDRSPAVITPPSTGSGSPDPPALARRLAAAGITAPQCLPRAMEGGADNHVFTAPGSDGQPLIVKVPVVGRHPRYQVAAWAARQLHHHGVPVPTMVWHGPDMAVETRCPGVPISQMPQPAAAALAQRAGQLLRKVHAVPVDGFGRLTPVGTATHRTLADWLLRTPADPPGPAAELAAHMTGALRAHLPELAGTVPRLLHGDWAARHVLSDGVTVTGIVDLESVRGGDPLADIAGWSLTEPPALTEALADGYFPTPPGPGSLLAITVYRLRIALFLLAYHARHSDHTDAHLRARQIDADLSDLAAGRPRLIPRITPRTTPQPRRTS